MLLFLVNAFYYWQKSVIKELNNWALKKQNTNLSVVDQLQLLLYLAQVHLLWIELWMEQYNLQRKNVVIIEFRLSRSDCCSWKNPFLCLYIPHKVEALIVLPSWTLKACPQTLLTPWLLPWHSALRWVISRKSRVQYDPL